MSPLEGRSVREYRERCETAPCVTWDGWGDGYEAKLIVIKPNMTDEDWAMVAGVAKSLLDQAESHT